MKVTSHDQQALLTPQQLGSVSRPIFNAGERTPSGTPEPSTTVEISGEALRRFAFSELLSAPELKLSLRSEEEYASMSFEQLVHELNGLDGDPIDDTGTMRLTRKGTDLELIVLERIINQQDETVGAANQLRKSLDDFTELAASQFSWLTNNSFDVTFQNGKGTIVSDILSADQVAEIQSLLETSNVLESEALLSNIEVYNRSLTKSMNMMIYEEKYDQRQSDGTGRELYFRSSPTNVEELTMGISYTEAAQSPSHFFSNLHQGLVGTTKWGGTVVYADEVK